MTRIEWRWLPNVVWGGGGTVSGEHSGGFLYILFYLWWEDICVTGENCSVWEMSCEFWGSINASVDPWNVEIYYRAVLNGLCFSFTTKEGSARFLGTAKRTRWRVGESNFDSRDQVSVFLHQSSLVFFKPWPQSFPRWVLLLTVTIGFLFYKKLICAVFNYLSHVKILLSSSKPSFFSGDFPFEISLLVPREPPEHTLTHSASSAVNFPQMPLARLSPERRARGALVRLRRSVYR